MSKPKIPNQRKANLQHKQRVEQYSVLIQQVYDRVAKEAARQAVLAGANSETSFSFDDYPLTKEAIKRLQAKFINEVIGIIMRGTSEEWKESNLIQDLVAKKVLTAYTGTSKHGKEYSRYFETNPDALKAFQERKDRGMNLSSRVWNISEQYKSELEESITAAIAPGTSAMSLAAQVKQYLKYPDKRFRRIKEKLADGTIKWHLSKNAKAFHPGDGKPGVYRSSARNAQRLARTEINMAYRTAEQKRWNQFDFVVGYEVKTTQNGHHVEDMCDMLAGKYPKTFQFTGWHPQCMCYCIPILKTEDEFWADDDVKSVNEVTDVPQNFKEWIRDNSDRIEAAEKRGNLPYFIRDNRDDVEYILHQELRKKTPLEIAAERHAARTDADIIDIQERWNAKLQRDANTKMVANNVLKVAQQWSEIDYSRLEQLIADNNLTALTEESRKVAQSIKAMRDEEKDLYDLIPDVHGWHNIFGISELKEAYKSIDRTLDYWKAKGMDLSTDSNLKTLKSELDKKIKFVENPDAYKHGAVQKHYWQVLQDSYIKYLDKVDNRIWWGDTEQMANQYITKLGAINPKLAKKIQKDFDGAVSNANKKGAQAYIYNLGKWDKIIDLESKLATSGSVDLTDLRNYIKDGKLNKAWAEYNNLKTKTANVYDSLYDGFTASQKTVALDFEKRIMDYIEICTWSSNDLRELSHRCDDYMNHILGISENLFSTQKSIFTAQEQTVFAKAMKKYLKETSINPNWIWGDDIGGIYHSMDWERKDFANKMLGRVNADELSLITRFSAGMTFYNAYNLRNTSAYFRQVWKNKLRKLSNLQDIRDQYRVIEEYTQALNSVQERMIRYKGITFRAVHSDGGKELLNTFENCWKTKQPWKNKAAASSSTDIDVSVSRFDNSGNYDVIMVIRNKTGVHIRPISEYDSEKEVMLIKDRSYTVIKKPRLINGKYIVELEEI